MKLIKKGDKLLSGAMFLGLGAFVAKILGAIYRVPLTNLLGGSGLGLYQMVFPVYTVLLDFSGAGVPSALSKIISSGDEENKFNRASEYLSSSLRLLLWLGLAFSLLMLFFARPLARAQGNVQAYLAYAFLSPAVLLVALLSCFRGYFQGLMNMRPTAISQIVEQIIKLVLGLLLVYSFLPSIEWAVAGATFAISVSEFVALLYLYIVYKKHKTKLNLKITFDKRKFKTNAKSIIKLTVPITLVGILLPLSQVVDSFLVLNILGGYMTNATALYGILSGVVATVIGLPVSVCYGVSAVAIPAVSKGKTSAEQNKKAIKAILLTIAVALPSAVFCYFFAPLIIRFLFRNIDLEERKIAINLLRLSSPCVLLLSLLQTCNAVLIGKGKPYLPLISLGLGVLVKELLNLALLRLPSLNIYGGAIAIIACYFIVCLVNLIMIFSQSAEKRVNNASKRAYRREYVG